MVDQRDVLDNICRGFPFLKDVDPALHKVILDHVSIARIPKGEIIFFEGDECTNIALLLSGVVRVYKSGESGREITLYRLGRGESCVLTASCIFSHGQFPAIAVVEEDVEAAVISAGTFRSWINTYEVWRNFVFTLLSKRLSEVMATIEEVAFRRMDIRIAELLIRLSANDRQTIRITHQDMAFELGTSREVVSRILKHFETEGLVVLNRGEIVIQNRDDLSSKAKQDK